MAGISDLFDPLVKKLRHPYAIVLIVILLIMSIMQAVRHDPGTGAHLTAGPRLISGDELYVKGFVYPPFSALVTAPLAFLSLHGAQVVWNVLSSIALLVLVGTSWSLGGGGELDFRERSSQRFHLILLLGCLCALRFAFNALQHLSLDLIIASLIMAGGLTALRGRFNWTAILWGLSAAFKGPPMLFAGYLVWRGKWLQAGLMIVVAVGVNLLPDLVSHPAQGGLWATRWFHEIIEPLAQPGFTPGDWHANILDNQSLAGEANRLFLTTFTVEPGGINVSMREGAIEAKSLKYIVYATDAIICLIVALIMRPGRIPGGSKWDGELSSRASLEISVVILLILLLSPMSSRSLFCTMLLPAFCLARAGIIGKDRVALTCVVVAIVGSVISFRAPFAHALNDEMHWLGIVTLCTMALLVGCLWLLVRHQIVARAEVGQSAGLRDESAAAPPGLP